MKKALGQFLGMVYLISISSWAIAGDGSLAPVTGGTFEHAPYAERVCSICHERDDQKNPGKVTLSGNETCYMCHDDFKSALSSFPHTHAPAQSNCVGCHNPHNGPARFFLKNPAPKLCTNCHNQIGTLLSTAATPHGALTSDDSCLNCHDPHASKVEKLLKGLPYDLCVNCHSRSDIVDNKGKKLVNMKELIDTKKYRHEPVAEKDCSSCHDPHGNDNFRLLVASYPAKFYSAFDPNNYALCFTCHDSAMVTERTTSKLTGFRNGSENLHYFHVNKTWGRTCRACHEVHAGEKIHIIRDSVPYGNGGWSLKINYEPLADGGRCNKTCHSTREYHR